MYPRLKQYPKELTILGRTWEVRFCRKIPGEEDHIVGLCHEGDMTIYIRLGQGPKATLETFIHEALHAVEFAVGCRLNHKSVYKIEIGFANFFVENFIPMCQLALLQNISGQQ